jgi:hypothetical protein
LKNLLKKRIKIEKEEDSAFISEAADQLTPFGGPVKFDESPALADQTVTSVFSVSSSLSEYKEECTQSSITLSHLIPHPSVTPLLR